MSLHVGQITVWVNETELTQITASDRLKVQLSDRQEDIRDWKITGINEEHSEECTLARIYDRPSFSCLCRMSPLHLFR